MALVGGDTTALARGGRTLAEVSSATRGAGTLLGECARSCAGAVGGELGRELERFAAATATFAEDLAVHVRATGWLAESIGGDLDRADGR